MFFLVFLQIADGRISNALLQFWCWIAYEITSETREIQNGYLQEMNQPKMSRAVIELVHCTYKKCLCFKRNEEIFVLERPIKYNHFFTISEFFCLIGLGST